MLLSKFTFWIAVLVFSFTTVNAQGDVIDKKTRTILKSSMGEVFDHYSGLVFREIINPTATGGYSPVQIFEITDSVENRLAGWVCLSEGLGRYDAFDYLVIYDPMKSVAMVRIINYRSSHGYQITSKKWLNKFTGLKASDKIEVGEEVDVISGATLSSFGLVKSLNQVNKLIDGL